VQGKNVGAGVSVLIGVVTDTTVAEVGAVHTFDPSSAVNTGNDTIDLGYSHRYQTGDAVVYQSYGGTDIGNLHSGQVYYVIVDASHPTQVKLALTRAGALAGQAIDLSLSGVTGSAHSLQAVAALNLSFNAGSSATVDIANSVIDLGASSTDFATGEA